VFGFYTFLPVRAFLNQNSFFADEREQYFSNQLHPELLGDRLSVSSITFALGSQLADWFSLGAGIDVAIFTESKVTVFVPDGSDQSHVLLSPDIHTNSKFKPYFAATLHPNARTSVVATLRTPFANTTQGENDLRFWNYTYPAGQTSVQQVYTISQGSEPLRFALGGNYNGQRLPDGRAPWEVGVQLLGERWSQYYDRHGVHPLDKWKDTVSVALGGGFLWRDRHVTADIGYVPSPVPNQTGRTNNVDDSRLVASAGIEGAVKFLGRDLEAGVTLFGACFLPREVSKNPNATHPVLDEFPDDATDLRTGLPAAGAVGLQTNNPGYPGWKSTGYMLGAGGPKSPSRVAGRPR
jgi:long-chain fatty acid transport protein